VSAPSFDARVEQIVRSLQVSGYENSGFDCQHTLAAFVHAKQDTKFAFVSLVPIPLRIGRQLPVTQMCGGLLA